MKTKIALRDMVTDLLEDLDEIARRDDGNVYGLPLDDLDLYWRLRDRVMSALSAVNE